MSSMTGGSDGFALVLTTANTEEEAARIAETLVEKRLAACVNVVGPIRSIYRWKDAVCRDEERLLLVKTRAGLFAQVREAVRAAHSYELPEMLLVRVDDVDPKVLEWLWACLV